MVLYNWLFGPSSGTKTRTQEYAEWELSHNGGSSSTTVSHVAPEENFGQDVRNNSSGPNREQISYAYGTHTRHAGSTARADTTESNTSRNGYRRGSSTKEVLPNTTSSNRNTRQRTNAVSNTPSMTMRGTGSSSRNGSRRGSRKDSDFNTSEITTSPRNKERSNADPRRPALVRKGTKRQNSVRGFDGSLTNSPTRDGPDWEQISLCSIRDAAAFYGAQALSLSKLSQFKEVKAARTALSIIKTADHLTIKDILPNLKQCAQNISARTGIPIKPQFHRHLQQAVGIAEMFGQSGCAGANVVALMSSDFIKTNRRKKSDVAWIWSKACGNLDSFISSLESCGFKPTRCKKLLKQVKRHSEECCGDQDALPYFQEWIFTNVPLTKLQESHSRKTSALKAKAKLYIQATQIAKKYCVEGVVMDSFIPQLFARYDLPTIKTIAMEGGKYPQVEDLARTCSELTIQRRRRLPVLATVTGTSTPEIGSPLLAPTQESSSVLWLLTLLPLLFLVWFVGRRFFRETRKPRVSEIDLELGMSRNLHPSVD